MSQILILWIFFKYTLTVFQKKKIARGKFEIKIFFGYMLLSYTRYKLQGENIF